jgi:hypothetical protein
LLDRVAFYLATENSEVYHSYQTRTAVKRASQNILKINEPANPCRFLLRLGDFFPDFASVFVPRASP